MVDFDTSPNPTAAISIAIVVIIIVVVGGGGLDASRSSLEGGGSLVAGVLL